MDEDLDIKESVRIYNALSFSLWQNGYEGIVQSHAIIMWKTLGAEDHREASKYLGVFLNRLKKRFDYSSDSPLSYVYIFEISAEHGLHSHILLTLPWDKAPTYAVWSRRCLTQLTGCSGDATTIKIVSPARAPSVKLHWLWARYVLKQLHPACALRYQENLPSLYEQF
jgi:hypothetical protein